MPEQLELIELETTEPEPREVIWIPCDDFAYEEYRERLAGDVWGEKGN